MSNMRSTGANMTRRDFLRTSSGLAVGASVVGLGGCTGGAPRGPVSDRFDIPDPKVKLPTGDVTFRLMDSGDTKAPYWKELFAAYQKKHGNITCQYDGLPWNRIEEVAPLGIRNGTAHDILQLPPSIPLPQAVAEGWVAPLEDLIPDFAQWKARFPVGTFADGVQVFNGKTYAVPLASDQRHLALLHYHKELMDKAGFDPQSEPLTWDTYRQAARKITQLGKGESYGVVFEIAQPGRLELWVYYQSCSAGTAAVNYAPHGYIDPRTGEFFYNSDGVAEAIELMLALKQDGSVFPGSNSLVAPQAWPRVVRGNAGMVSAGSWVAAQWQIQSPEFKFGVASHPVRDSGSLPASYPIFGTDVVHVFASSKVKEIAGDILSYVAAPAGQQAWGEIVGVGNPPILEEARTAVKATVSEQSKRCLELAEKLMTRPEPVIRNPEVAKAAQEHKPLKPSFGEVIQAAFVGEITDVRKALRELDSRSNKAFDEAIAAAVKKGAKVSRADYVFPDWDPSTNYVTKTR